MIYRITRSQLIPSPIEDVWSYFATPKNLDEMTPENMKFEITFGGNEQMYEGQLLEYRIALLPGIRTTWLTEIRHVEYLKRFVDEQRIGPYKFWYHEHRFSLVDTGTKMEDIVTYELPFGPIGDTVHSLIIRVKLRTIFDYRSKKVVEIFKQK